jgi:hypothetical protein
VSGNVVDHKELPENFPTHSHDGEFWEKLDRVIATFGFLEDTLAKAIFAFTATTEYETEDIDKAFSEWIPKLERSLSDPLGGLIDTYGKAVRSHSNGTIDNFDLLIEDIKKASKLRNVLCHGSWGSPDSNGASIPFFINKQKEKFETPININFLIQVQKHTCDLICSVINTVTHMGWQFPGSNGPGKVILKSASVIKA